MAERETLGPGAVKSSRKMSSTGDPQALDWNKHFALSAEPKWWAHNASVLMKSADLLWAEFMRPVFEVSKLPHGSPDIEKVLLESSSKPNHGLPALLLSGLAVENILKAIRLKQWTAERKSPVANGKLDLYFTRHNLLDYARHTKVALTSDDEQLLLRLRQCVEWTGRYPVATVAAKDMKTLRLGPFRVVASQDYYQVHSLFPRLEELYRTLDQS